MDIISPSGRVYKWDKDEPPTEADFKALQEYDAKAAGPQAREPKRMSQPFPDPSHVYTPEPQSMAGSSMLVDIPGVLEKTGVTPFAKEMVNVGASGARLMGDWLAGNKGKVADITIQGGVPALAQRFTGPAGPLIGPAVRTAVRALGGGAGDSMAQLRQMGSGERENFSAPEAVGSAVATSIPVRTNAGRSMTEVAKEAAKFAAVNAAAKATESGLEGKDVSVGELGRAASAGGLGAFVAHGLDKGGASKAEISRMERAAARDETFRMAQNAGFVLDPALSNPGLATKSVDKIGGVSATQNAMKEHNAKVATQLAKEEIGVSPDRAMDDLLFADRQIKMAAPYKQLASYSPTAAQAVKDWEEASSDARSAWKRFRVSGDTGARDEARKFETMAANAETEMTQNAWLAGNPGIMLEIEQAKKDLAKLHVVEAATNTATGEVDPKVIGEIRNARGKGYLDGNLETMARLALAMPQVVGERTAASIPAHISNAVVRTAMGAAGFGVGGPVGAGVAAVGVPPLVRRFAMGDTYQKNMALPLYGTGNPDMMANIGRFATQQAGR